MKLRVADPEALRNLSSRNIRIYLATHGWQRRDEAERASIWTLSEKGQATFEVIPPSTDNVPDFEARVAEILRALSAAEERSELDVLRELTQVRYDVQYFRTSYEGPEGTAPLADAASALKAVQSMLVSAATTLELPDRIVLPHRSPAGASALAKRALAGPTSEGSFLLSVWVPVPPRLSQEEDFVLFDATTEPFERAATLRLHQSLRALSEAIEEVEGANAGVEAFVQRVERGVSANLCEAVSAALGESRSGLEARFSWALGRPIRVADPVIRFASEHQTVLQEAAREMRELVPEEEVLLQGNVVRLHRDTEHGPGDVTISGVLVGDPDGRLRRVTTSLMGRDYEAAIRAHREFQLVEVIGELYRRGTRTYLRNPRNFATRPIPE